MYSVVPVPLVPTLPAEKFELGSVQNFAMAEAKDTTEAHSEGCHPLYVMATVMFGEHWSSWKVTGGTRVGAWEDGYASL